MRVMGHIRGELRGCAIASLTIALAACGGRTLIFDLGGGDAGGVSSSASSRAAADGATRSSGSRGQDSGWDSGGSPADSGTAERGVAVFVDASDPDGAVCAIPVAPQCSQNPTEQVVTQTPAAFEAAISARWVLCGSESVFGQNGGDSGLEITSDGNWFKLYPALGGALVRGAGFDEQGTWDTVLQPQAANDPQPFQLNLHILGSGTFFMHPTLASNPPAMRLINEGSIANYVLDPAEPVGTTRCAP
jgi:hypothetical protein